MQISLTKNRVIHNYSNPYIIAEIGANHNGDMSLAKKLVDSAKSCGVDAVKFQSWTPKSVNSKEEYNRNQSYDDGDEGKKHFGSLKEMVDKYYLTEDQHYEIAEYCNELEIDFCSTPFSIYEVDLLQKLDIPFYKVASMDVNNYQLLSYIAQKQKPIILSTGMATIAEIDNAVKVIEKEGNNQIVILHCIAIYPPKIKDINLNNIAMLQKAFDYPIGFSDHSKGTSIPLASIALGSCLIEKHFTLDKDMPGWDHAISADPKELMEIVKESKNIQKSLGSFNRIVSADEEEKKMKFRRSLVVVRNLKKGETIRTDDLDAKRPGTGIPPNEINSVIGRKVSRDIQEDELINRIDLK
jgi:sialic acid synthase SpsE